MQVEEEAMTEEEYEAELAAQEAAKAANVKEEEEDILTPQEVEAMKAKIANYAPWMTVDPEARARSLALTPATVARAARRHAPGPARPRHPLRERSATLFLASATPRLSSLRRRSRARRRRARTGRTRRRRRSTACSSIRRRPSSTRRVGSSPRC